MKDILYALKVLLRGVGAMPMAVMLCLGAVMLTGCVSCGVANRQNKEQGEKNMFVVRIAEIDAEFSAMLKSISSDTVGDFDENRVKELMDEKSDLQRQLAEIAETKQKRENTESRLDEIFTVIEGLKNRPMRYDDQIVRQIIECIVVESKDRIKVIFIGGLEVTEELIAD